MKNKLKFFLTKEKIINNKNLILFIIVFLFCGLAFFRFYNLEYSDFQDSERTTRFILSEGETWQEFLLEQRKGPLQFLLTVIPLSITNDPTNNLALRLPFSIFNFLCFIILYLIIFKLTKSHLACFLSVGTLSVNGFLVGFGRIAQYQSLNIFFSFLAILATLYLLKSTKKTILFSFLAGSSYSVSFLAHWDAIYYSPILIYFGICFLRRKDINIKIKIVNVFIVFLSFLLFFLTFLIPYIQKLQSPENSNLVYLNTRVGFEGSEVSRHYEIFKLYNPFITDIFLGFGLIVSLYFYKKTFPFIIWTITSFLAIKLFMTTPKTHIYNYIIPLSITATLGYYNLISYLFKKSNKIYRYLGISTFILVFLSFSFLIYQSYVLFIDNSIEYPWNSKRYLNFEAPELISNEVITFGFPYKRSFDKIREIIPKNCFYKSNETKAITGIYIEGKWGESKNCFYYIKVEKPFNLDGKNVIYPGLRTHKQVYEFKNKNGDTQTRVFKLK